MSCRCWRRCCNEVWWGMSNVVGWTKGSGRLFRTGGVWRSGVAEGKPGEQRVQATQWMFESDSRLLGLLWQETGAMGKSAKLKTQAFKNSKEGQYHGLFVYSSFPRYHSLQSQKRIKISRSVQQHGNEIMMWWLWWMINLMQASASRFSWHNEVRWLPDCSSRIMNQSSVTARSLTLYNIPMLFI